MWLVDRQSEGRGSGRTVVPDLIGAALLRWYAGQGSRSDEEAGITLMQQARMGAKWLACDCLGANARPPILTPAFLSEAETYYLRRLTSAKRPEHRTDCPFFRDRIPEARSPDCPTDPPGGYFEVLRPAPETLAKRPQQDASDDRTRNAAIPRLARLLWRLIDGAGLNRVAPADPYDDERSIAREFKAIETAAHSVHVAPGIELGRVLWTHGEAFHRRRVYGALRDLTRRWPRGHAPQAFLTLFATSFCGATLEVAGCEAIRIANRIQSPSVRGNSVKGPYLACIVVGECPEAHGFAPLRAYAQPILSGHRFLPVDSEFERDVARALIRARHSLLHAGISLAIEKPVFDRLTPIGPCRPDFIVEARSVHTGAIRPLIIEAMGPDDPGCLAAKSTAHPRMEQIARVLKVTPEEVAGGKLPLMVRMALDI